MHGKAASNYERVRRDSRVEMSSNFRKTGCKRGKQRERSYDPRKIEFSMGSSGESVTSIDINDELAPLRLFSSENQLKVRKDEVRHHFRLQVWTQLQPDLTT
jgi:hypothetical protein